MWRDLLLKAVTVAWSWSKAYLDSMLQGCIDWSDVAALWDIPQKCQGYYTVAEVAISMTLLQVVLYLSRESKCAEVSDVKGRVFSVFERPSVTVW